MWFTIDDGIVKSFKIVDECIFNSGWFLGKILKMTITDELHRTLSLFFGGQLRSFKEREVKENQEK